MADREEEERRGDKFYWSKIEKLTKAELCARLQAYGFKAYNENRRLALIYALCQELIKRGMLDPPLVEYTGVNAAASADSDPDDEPPPGSASCVALCTHTENLAEEEKEENKQKELEALSCHMERLKIYKKPAESPSKQLTDHDIQELLSVDQDVAVLTASPDSDTEE